MRKPRKIKVELAQWRNGSALYVNDVRVAGIRPTGPVTMSERFNIDAKELRRAMASKPMSELL